MSTTIHATYNTRRGAELAVERLVQEYRIDRSAISVRPEGAENTAGDIAAGADGKVADVGDGGPQLNGRVEVVVTHPQLDADTLQAALKETGAESIKGI